jgi:hypothetical protein
MTHFSLSVTTATGAVFWALVAIAIAGLARAYRARLTPALQRMFLRFPGRFRPAMRRLIYLVYPTWRSYARGSDRTRNGIESRLLRLRSRSSMPVILVGAIYIDVALTPVSMRNIQNTEYGDLDTVRVQLGGAAYFTGHHLWEAFSRRTYLFSRIGKGDIFSRHLTRLVKEVPWIKGHHLSASGTAQCGVSVHLLDRDGTFSPTLTHRGALTEFTWATMLKELQHRTRRGGGVIFLSGFFRTSLNIDLIESIRTISPGVLLVVDHGRFQPEYHLSGVQALVSAFTVGAIDIYICTYGELMAFGRGAGLQIGPDLPEEDAVKRFQEAGILPKVTVVRGDQEPGVPTAILVTDRTIRVIEDGPADWTPKSAPGGKEAFTAGFLNHLFNPESQGDLDEIMDGAVHAGLRLWARRA